jgi:hypothetical protein
MTLRELIEQLEKLRSEHGENIEVNFTIPAHEGSYESDYGASELTESEKFQMPWKGEIHNILSLTLQ